MHISIDREAINDRLRNGDLWVGEWGEWWEAAAPTCLHGAIRHCQPSIADAVLIECVGRVYDFGTSDNDESETWDDIFSKVPSLVNEFMLEETFGPQWAEIVSFVRNIETMSEGEMKSLFASTAKEYATNTLFQDGGGFLLSRSYYELQLKLCGYASLEVLFNKLRLESKPTHFITEINSKTLRAAAIALGSRHKVGDTWFQMDHYKAITAPFAAVFGPLHPDDKE